MKKPIAGLIVLAFICALAVPCHVSASSPPPQAIKAAQNGMKSFLAPSRLDHLHEHGFDSKEDLDKAVLGEGIEIFTIPPEKLLDDSVAQDLQSLVISTNQWSFLVLVDDKPKTIVSVGPINGKWVPFELGSPGFAKIMSNLLSVWPASAGYRFRYIMIYQASSSLIELSKDDKVIGIIRGHDPRNVLGVDDLARIFPALRASVKRNIETWKDK